MRSGAWGLGLTFVVLRWLLGRVFVAAERLPWQEAVCGRSSLESMKKIEGVQCPA